MRVLKYTSGDLPVFCEDRDHMPRDEIALFNCGGTLYNIVKK